MKGGEEAMSIGPRTTPRQQRPSEITIEDIVRDEACAGHLRCRGARRGMEGAARVRGTGRRDRSGDPRRFGEALDVFIGGLMALYRPVLVYAASAHPRTS